MDGIHFDPFYGDRVKQVNVSQTFGGTLTISCFILFYQFLAKCCLSIDC